MAGMGLRCRLGWHRWGAWSDYRRTLGYQGETLTFFVEQYRICQRCQEIETRELLR